uniref:Interleukin-12 subunit beta n=1 Tax=Denticeps clupeoides TaxID=299321 RepID=A0AAY4ASZ8_9TELE
NNSFPINSLMSPSLSHMLYVFLISVVAVPVKAHESVSLTLSCGNHTGGVQWEKNGVPVGRGKQLNIVVKDMNGGNYTCHDDAGNMLNHVVVLQEGLGYRPAFLLKSPEGEYVTCTSKNYNGHFHCKWTKSSDRRKAEVLHFSVTRNISCSLDGDGTTLSCEDKRHCTFAEEEGRITVSIYLRNEFRLEKYQTHFFIYEIVKPDKVNISKVEQNTFNWTYPSTWSRPSCYFRLAFQIKVVGPHESCDKEKKVKTIHSLSVTICKKSKYKLCVRSQEEVSDFMWSEWSSYM